MMQISRTMLPLALCVGAIGVALTCGNAEAATYRAHYISATAVCSGPLPIYDNQLKRRSLGILNQGTSSVFISCSVPSDFEGDLTNASNVVNVYFQSFGGSGAINCTLNAGLRGNSGSVAGSADIAVDSMIAVGWNNINKMDTWGAYNFSCILPPNVEMSFIIYQEGDTSNGL